MVKSQTATEYLIILAVVIVIALIVVGVLGGIPNMGGKSSSRTANIGLSNQKIGIVSSSVYDCGTKLVLRNNNPEQVTVRKVIINNTNCQTNSIPSKVNPGESLEITCQDICLEINKKFIFKTNITWESQLGVLYEDFGKIEGSVGKSVSIGGINGVCGSANGTSVSTVPTTNLCSAGTASSTSGSGPWNWNCQGSNGGTTASCSAGYTTSPINGACGSANGQSFSSAPTNNLCSVGTASSVSGSGPWTWNCQGSNGGTTASCSASSIHFELYDGLVAYWPFDNNMQDYSGSNNHGTCSNCPTVSPGKIGQAYHFSSPNSITSNNMNNIPGGNADRTVCAWVNTESESPGGHSQMIINYGPRSNTNSGEFGLFLGHWDHKFSFVSWGAWADIISPNVMPTNSWIYVCFTYDKSTGKLYENGMFVIENNLQLNTVLNQIFIGGAYINPWGKDTYFNGKIDELAIWNRALAPSEIQELFSRGQSGIGLLE
jgi:hypothetical protein